MQQQHAQQQAKKKRKAEGAKFTVRTTASSKKLSTKLAQAEHQRFLDGHAAMMRSSSTANFDVVANGVGTRSRTQCRSHAQKYFKKQKKAASVSRTGTAY